MLLLTFDLSFETTGAGICGDKEAGSGFAITSATGGCGRRVYLRLIAIATLVVTQMMSLEEVTSIPSMSAEMNHPTLVTICYTCTVTFD